MGTWSTRGLDALFVLTLAVFVVSGREAAPFHGDESTFAWMSRDLETLLAAGPDALAFDPDTREPLAQQLRVLNGSLAPLTIGVARRTAGFARADLNGPWVWVFPERPRASQWHFNVSAGRLPGAALLASARWPSVLATAASVALVFAIGVGVSGSRLAAWVAAACYATSPALLLDGRRAMQEGWLLATTALLVWVALAMFRTRGSGRDGLPTPWLAGLAVAAALALAAKHSAGVVVAGVWAASAAVPWLGASDPARRREDVRRTLVGLLGAGLASLAFLTLLVPVWWSPARCVLLLALAALTWSFAGLEGDRALRGIRLGAVAAGLLALALDPAMPGATSAQLRSLVTERGALMREQVGRFEPTGSRVGTLLRESFVPEPRYFEDPAWADVPEIERQIETYRASGLTGRTGWLRWPSGVVFAALVGLGVASRGRRASEPGSALLLAWLAFPAIVLLANPLPWSRYYLMLQAPLAVFAGCGAASLAARGERRS